MIIDFIQIQKLKFDQYAQKIMAKPECFLDFDSVSDFYKSVWLNDFPMATTWSVSGLDDGAEQFYISIQYKNQYLNLDIQQTIWCLSFKNMDGEIFKQKVLRHHRPECF